MKTKFVPREITPQMAAEGYNNKGRGKLLGYISDPKFHEASCPHRKSANAHCACRVGLWQDAPPRPKKVRGRGSPGGWVAPVAAKATPASDMVAWLHRTCKAKKKDATYGCDNFHCVYCRAARQIVSDAEEIAALTTPNPTTTAGGGA